MRKTEQRIHLYYSYVYFIASEIADGRWSRFIKNYEYRSKMLLRDLNFAEDLKNEKNENLVQLVGPIESAKNAP